MADQRLPVVNSDDGLWGTLLVQYLTKEHYNDGTNNTANGGHQNVTIRPGTASAAPLTLTSGTNLTTPANGAMEYDGSFFYLTQGSARKKIAIYDGGTAATGDTYYRDASGNFTRLAPGNGGQQLTMSGGVPAWRDTTYATSLKTTGYTISSSDTVIFANASGGAVTITLPQASTLAGYRFYIKRVDASANAVTVARTNTDTIDGMTSLTLDLQYTALIVVSDGSNWFIL